MITAKRKEVFKAIFGDLKLEQVEISNATGKSESLISRYLNSDLSVPEAFIHKLVETYNLDLAHYMSYKPLPESDNVVNEDPVTYQPTMTEIEYLKRENELLRKNEILAAENRKLLIEKTERLEKERLGSPNNN